MKNIIEVKNLRKTYKSDSVETHVLKGIDMAVGAGEFISIIGPSGAGKSTLLYQMSLLDDPTFGQIIIDGTDVSDFNESQSTAFRLKNFGYVFQDYGLVPELSAEENVMVPILMRGFSVSDARSHAREALISLDLEHRFLNLPSQLSGGEQQRVSVARAVAGNPKIIFADEPTASLDSIRSKEVIDIFLKLRDRGQTIVMVTHEEEFARMTDRIVELKDGLVV